MDRCSEPGDWLRREIELAIDEKHNIVPMFFKDFRFGTPNVKDKLTGTMRHLSRYNGLNVHEDYFDKAMQRLRTQFLSKPLDTVLHPVSSEVQKMVRAEQVAVDKALEQIDDVLELVRQADEKPDKLNRNVSLLDLLDNRSRWKKNRRSVNRFHLLETDLQTNYLYRGSPLPGFLVD